MLCADDNHMKTYSQASERLATDKRGFRLGQCKGQPSSACLSPRCQSWQETFGNTYLRDMTTLNIQRYFLHMANSELSRSP